MIIRKKEYDLEKQILEQRIDELEWLICKGEHDFIKVSCKLIADGKGYGNLYGDVCKCKKCGKVIKRG